MSRRALVAAAQQHAARQGRLDRRQQIEPVDAQRAGRGFRASGRQRCELAAASD